MGQVSKWTIFEVELHSAQDYANPFWDVRFSPDEVGEWQ